MQKFVYVVIRKCDYSSFTDRYGEDAGEKEEIIAIFDSEAKADAKVQMLDLESEIEVKEFGCDPEEYEIQVWEVL